MREIDLRYQGVPNVCCCFADEAGGWLLDPGPELTHATLVEQLGGWIPDRILLTHVHFDHAGAAGRLAALWPRAEVWVHERGARHLVDPARLLSSARRVYGDDFDRLWGEVVPVPADRLRVLDGGESVCGWRVEHTPGHASHHVAYLHEESGAAFAGDVAGVRIGDGPVLPTSLPPDIDRELWLGSIDLIDSWRPTALNVAHFGSKVDVEDHLDELRAQLWGWSELARDSDRERFAADTTRFVAARSADPAVRRGYELANPPGMLWDGWARYWSRREQEVEAQVTPREQEVEAR